MMKIRALWATLLLVATTGIASAGLMVTNPGGAYGTAVDPAGSQTVDGDVGSFIGLAAYNTLADRWTLDFESAPFVVGQTLDSVAFTSPTSQTITFTGLAVDNSNPYSPTSGSKYLVGNGIAGTVTSQISFATPVTAFGLTTTFYGGGIRVSYYDAAGNQIYAPQQNGQGESSEPYWRDWFFGYASATTPVKTVTIERLYVNDWYSIDDVSFVQVPEPATMALLVLGGAGLMRRSTRKV